MRFEEVLPLLKEGWKIRRKWWRNKDYISRNSLYTFGEIVNEINEIYALTINDLCADDWELVEAHKVKLRDLTEEQYRKKKKKNCRAGKCSDCVFTRVNCFSRSNCWIKDKSLFSDKFLDQEIEVEEDD